LENQNMFIPNEDIFSSFLNLESERQQSQSFNDPFDTIFKDYREPSIQPKIVFVEKEKPSQLFSQPESKPANKFLNRKLKKISQKDTSERKFSCDLEPTNDITRKHERNDLSHADSTYSKKGIFKTLKAEKEQRKKEEPKDVRKMIKLMKNRISARKCRQKKKEYFDTLEEKVEKLEKELEKYKLLNQQKNMLDIMMENLQEKEKEITKTDKSKTQGKKGEFKAIQNNLLFEFYKRIIKAVMPIEYNIFASKFIKFNDISSCESTNTMIDKLVENQEILDGIYDLKNDFLTKTNLTNLTLPQKFFIFFEKLKQFTSQFNELTEDLFNFEECK